MAAPQEIEFIISPDGNVEFTIKGAKGRQCLPIAKLFELLGETTSDRPTPEFYAQEEVSGVTVTQQRR